MQTPSLPASSTSSARNSAENFISDKPSDAREQFGDVMNRTLNSGTGILPVRPRSQEQDSHSTISNRTTEHDSDKKASPLKSKNPHHRASDERTNSDNSASANAHFIGLAVPTMPAPVSTPAQPSGNPDELPNASDPIAPISADATNTVVANANPNETETDDSTAKPIPAGLETQAAETTGSIELPQKPPSADIAQQLAKQAPEGATDPAEPALSSDSDPPLAQIAELKNANESMSARPPDPHGTSAAKQDLTMKKVEKMQKVAGSAEQDLPGNPAMGSEDLPKGQKISEKAASQSDKMESAAIELPTRVSTSVDAPFATITSAAPSAVESRVLERTHDIVALHAMRLTDTGADTLHVVVKPGAGVQISLELRQSARGIEVRAELHKGDYDQLSRHWPDLQQRLEARGVRVSTLTPSENYTGTGHHFHQSKQQSSQQDSLQAGAFAEFALAGSMTEAPGARAARASAHRGWESWA